MSQAQNYRKTVLALRIITLVAGLYLGGGQVFTVHSPVLVLSLRSMIVLGLLFELLFSRAGTPWKLSWFREEAAGLILIAVFILFTALSALSPLAEVYRFPIAWLIVFRNGSALLGLGGRLKRLGLLLENISLHPAQTLVISFLFIILIGTILLMTPPATVPAGGLHFIDALFTATSAVCVTGLAVVDTASYFTLYGRIIILLLIQAGGLGIMLLSYSAAWVLTHRLNFTDKLNIAYMTNQQDLSQVGRSMTKIVGVTLLIEFIGAIFLALGFMAEGLPLAQSLWYGVFHSISAFCNAGFALFSDSFESFRSSVPINLTLSALIILGGISFAVIFDLAGRVGLRGKAGGERSRLSLNTRVVLSTTVILLLISTLLMYYSEHGNSLAAEGTGAQYLAAFFQAVTLRTAGFNTVSFSAMSSAAIWVSMLFMVIGGASGSTAGGIKVNTIAVIYAYLRSRFRRQNRVLMFNFALSRNTASNALVLFVFAIFAISTGFLLLLLSEEGTFTDILFETVSAFGTVGLSRGFTSSLSSPGRLIIIVLMFMGRLGPLTLLTALADRETESDVIYPEQEILIG